jgi:hypothetical protein
MNRRLAHRFEYLDTLRTKRYAGGVGFFDVSIGFFLVHD